MGMFSLKNLCLCHVLSWADTGQQCAKVLLQEIKVRGYNGSYTILAGFLSHYPKTGEAFS